MWQYVHPTFLTVESFPKQQAVREQNGWRGIRGNNAGEGSITARDVEGMDDVTSFRGVGINCAISVVWNRQTTFSLNKGLCSF
jgi:hypothetical protein